MKPRLHVITLAVGDLGRELKFYRDLGFESVSGPLFSKPAHPSRAAARIEHRRGIYLSMPVS